VNHHGEAELSNFARLDSHLAKVAGNCGKARCRLIRDGLEAAASIDPGRLLFKNILTK
jgi:hypothetical protein